MEIKTKKEKSTIIVSVNGRIDAVTAPSYEKAIKDLLQQESQFVIDFGGLDYISSAGLRAILVTAKALKAKGGKMHMANTRGTVREVFDISGFGSIFSMYDSVDEALADMG